MNDDDKAAVEQKLCAWKDELRDKDKVVKGKFVEIYLKKKRR